MTGYLPKLPAFPTFSWPSFRAANNNGAQPAAADPVNPIPARADAADNNTVSSKVEAAFNKGILAYFIPSWFADPEFANAEEKNSAENLRAALPEKFGLISTFFDALNQINETISQIKKILRTLFPINKNFKIFSLMLKNYLKASIRKAGKDHLQTFSMK